MEVRRWGLVLVVWGVLFGAFPAQAQMTPAFAKWFDGFAQEAMHEGVAPATIQKVLPILSLDESVIELDQKQPEGKVSFATYLKNTLPKMRVEKGRRLMQENRDVLYEISAKSGVPASVIVALWGIESSFGVNMGDFAVVNSLATLAYEGRRADFFKKELIEALHVLEEERLEPEALTGSWAGAMGQCQFMPSTFRRHAVDYDGDGRRDIWTSDIDALASIANYLSAEGWQGGVSWGREVSLPPKLSAKFVGLEATKTLAQWSKLGVRTAQGKPLQSLALQASLIQPDGPTGRSFLVYDNFRAVMRWNRSTYFATAVGLFADQLSGR